MLLTLRTSVTLNNIATFLTYDVKGRLRVVDLIDFVDLVDAWLPIETLRAESELMFKLELKMRLEVDPKREAEEKVLFMRFLLSHVR